MLFGFCARHARVNSLKPWAFVTYSRNKGCARPSPLTGSWWSSVMRFSVLMTDALTSKARPAAADHRAARSELAGVRSAVSLLARRVAKRRDMFLAGWRCCFVAVARLRRRRVEAQRASAPCPADLSSVRMSVWSTTMRGSSRRAQILSWPELASCKTLASSRDN